MFVEQISEQDPFAVEEYPATLDLACAAAKEFFARTTTKQAFFGRSYDGIALRLDKETFDEILLKEVLEAFKKLVLAFSKQVKKYLIDSIVCVGGSANIAQFQRILEIIFNKNVICPTEPELAPARGAAFMAAKYFSVYRLRAFALVSDLQAYKTVPYSLGVATANELLDFTVLHVIVPRGTPIPLETPRSTVLKAGSQLTFKVSLLEGDCIVSKQNKPLYQFDINIDDKAKEAAQDIKIELSIEEDFIIVFKVKVDNREFFQKFKHVPDSNFFEAVQPKEIETDKVKKRMVRARIAEIIKKIENRYKGLTNVQLKKRMEHVYQKACDYKVYAKEVKFELAFIQSKLAELEKL